MIIQRGSFVSENMVHFIRQNFMDTSKLQPQRRLEELKSSIDQQFGECFSLIMWEDGQEIDFDMGYQDECILHLEHEKIVLMAHLNEDYFFRPEWYERKLEGVRTNYQDSYKYPRRFTEHQTTFIPSFDLVYRPYAVPYRVDVKRQ